MPSGRRAAVTFNEDQFITFETSPQSENSSFELILQEWELQQEEIKEL